MDAALWLRLPLKDLRSAIAYLSPSAVGITMAISTADLAGHIPLDLYYRFHRKRYRPGNFPKSRVSIGLKLCCLVKW